MKQIPQGRRKNKSKAHRQLAKGKRKKKVMRLRIRRRRFVKTELLIPCRKMLRARFSSLILLEDGTDFHYRDIISLSTRMARKYVHKHNSYSSAHKHTEPRFSTSASSHCVDPRCGLKQHLLSFTASLRSE